MDIETFKIGTRNSPLALVQANVLKDLLREAYPDLVVELVSIQSNADWKKSEGEKPLCEENGGKGLFAKEIEQALLDGTVDCGVHSLKDMASFLPDGLVADHVLPRANPCDAFVSKGYKKIEDLPVGAIVGSCSARRTAIALSKRPDLNLVPFRGNVQTRLDKVEAGDVDATFLAMAGLERLGIQDFKIHSLNIDDMLPACGQGVICMERRIEDTRVKEILDEVHCMQTGLCVFAEREVLRILDGSCHTPIGAFARMNQGLLNLRAQVYALDGSIVFEKVETAPCSTAQEAADIGKAVGMLLKEELPEGFLS